MYDLVYVDIDTDKTDLCKYLQLKWELHFQCLTGCVLSHPDAFKLPETPSLYLFIPGLLPMAPIAPIETTLSAC